MQKHIFTGAERYAVWLHHGKRCWLCLEPLDLVATTVDHVVPESLTDHPTGLHEMIDLYGLPATFNINSFENWLPAHNHCNQSKSRRRLEYVPKQKFIFEELVKKADSVRKTAVKIGQRGKKGKVLATLLTALENETLNIDDVDVGARVKSCGNVFSGSSPV